MEYFYTVEITGGRFVKLRELSLEDYKNLQKACVDDISFESYLSHMIQSLAVGALPEINTIDLFIISIMIRYYSISDTKTFYTYVTGKQAKMKVDIATFVDKVRNRANEMFNGYIELGIEDFIADTVVIDPMNDENPIKHFRTDSGKIIEYEDGMEQYIPASIQSKISEKIKEIRRQMTVEFFDITLESGKVLTIDFRMTKSYIISLIKQIIKDDLVTLYKNLYDVKTKMSIDFCEHKHITFSEFELYITMFNSEQESQQREEDRKNPMSDMNLPQPKN